MNFNAPIYNHQHANYEHKVNRQIKVEKSQTKKVEFCYFFRFEFSVPMAMPFDIEYGENSLCEHWH